MRTPLTLHFNFRLVEGILVLWSWVPLGTGVLSSCCYPNRKEHP